MMIIFPARRECGLFLLDTICFAWSLMRLFVRCAVLVLAVYGLGALLLSYAFTAGTLEPSEAFTILGGWRTGMNLAASVSIALMVLDMILGGSFVRVTLPDRWAAWFDRLAERIETAVVAWLRARFAVLESRIPRRILYPGLIMMFIGIMLAFLAMVMSNASHQDSVVGMPPVPFADR